MKKLFVPLVLSLSLFFAGCGFQLPSQTKIANAIPTIHVTGDYHHPFYKIVIRKLRLNGVKVIAQNSDLNPDTKNTQIPHLMLPSPLVNNPVVAVDSKGQALESNLHIAVNATLIIGSHKPILMHNSITRSIIEKTGQALAANTQQELITLESYEELATDLVLRLSYLGRQSDPDVKAPSPADLLESEGETYQGSYSGMTVIEALKAQDRAEKNKASKVSLDSLNNHKKVLGDNPQLPKQRAILLHQAPGNSGF